MVSTYTANKRIEQPGFNDYVDTWDVPINNDWAIIDLALGGSVSINTTGLSGNQTLGTAQYQPLKIILTGTPAAAVNYRVPAGVGGIWVVRNNTSGGFAVTFSSAAGGSSVNVPAGQNVLVTCDGSADGMVLADNTAPAAAGSNTQLQFNNGGILAGDSLLTWDGTTLRTLGLLAAGNTRLGNQSTDTLQIDCLAVTIPNGLNFGSNNLFISGGKVGIGTATLGAELLTVAGAIYSTAVGYKFPDGTTQATAALTTTPGGSNTQVQFNDAGTFGGDSGLVFNKTTNALTVLGPVSAAGATLGGTLTMTASAINAAARVDVASATPAIGTAASNYIRITGTSTITGFGTVASGFYRDVLFASALQLTNSANLILPNNGDNISVAAGDTAGFVSESAGVWRCIWYQRANGSPLYASVPGYSALNTSVTAVSSAYTLPLKISEGTQLFSKVYNGRSGNKILIAVDVASCYGGNSSVAVGIFINGATNALATAVVSFPNTASAGYPNRVVYAYTLTGSSVTITARIAGTALSLGQAVMSITEFVE